MDRAQWHAHLVSVSRLFVEHTKLFMLRSGVTQEGGSEDSASQRVRSETPALRGQHVHTDRSGDEGEEGLFLLFVE